ncbi:hypothetical protein GRO01_01780 [Gluconobacter roseus NBRC 3990]|uniref:Uncharacterized protein n=1 Tax=Gluconobacter roseus NBRC 3990 TaxID=1307950 RepID=A0A4Y3M024_9PROT|nr:hypothetical protein GRO01_01780 [Gluconobacter roseus NBRC 3990]GLP93062.1 hypothetical protein GCM10007871_10400 [Gluconobacter roseus NBRC 3990]
MSFASSDGPAIGQDDTHGFPARDGRIAGVGGVVVRIFCIAAFDEGQYSPVRAEGEAPQIGSVILRIGSDLAGGGAPPSEIRMLRTPSRRSTQARRAVFAAPVRPLA